jgi:hypothetical protein
MEPIASPPLDTNTTSPGCTVTHLQIVDVEAVLVKLLLPNETLGPTGLLFLVKKLFERNQVGYFQFARAEIVLETNRIPVHYGTRPDTMEHRPTSKQRTSHSDGGLDRFANHTHYESVA